MRVGTDTVVGIRYTITDAAGQVVDRTPADAPWTFVFGSRTCPPGLERALEARTVGDRIHVALPPSETYGERREEGVFTIARDKLAPGEVPEVGRILAMVDARGETELRIVEVGETTITVDANHPLAGHTLDFAVEIVSVRPATAGERLAGEVLPA
jgi:FKBP-type peptidyl-prolyl cis-trans isomerase SlyD